METLQSVPDLSLEHHPLTEMFPLLSQLSPEAWDRYKLSDDQVAHFHEVGYVAGIRILDVPQADRLCEELIDLANPEHPGHALFHEYHSNESADPSRVLFHALGAWRVKPGFHDLLWNPAFVIPAAQLLGGAVRFWHDQLFCKPAQHGGVVAWHQDYSYWTRTKPMAHLTCWIGLDESREDNGCLRYIPGSHHWDLLPITGLAGDMDAIRSVLTDEHWSQWKPIPIELKRGEATFHHPLMVHGSFENSTERPRRAVVLNAMRDGVKSDSDEPLLKGVPSIPTGMPVDGQFFPLLGGKSR